jgi:hypothetical protein
MAAIGIGVVCGAGDEWAVVAAGAPAEYDAAESAGAGAETARTCDGRTRRFQRGASEAAGSLQIRRGNEGEAEIRRLHEVE